MLEDVLDGSFSGKYFHSDSISSNTKKN